MQNTRDFISPLSFGILLERSWKNLYVSQIRNADEVRRSKLNMHGWRDAYQIVRHDMRLDERKMR